MSGDVKKTKKDKEIVVELENQIRDINQQFVDQLKSLDHRLDINLSMVSEMLECYRRQVEVQSEYAKNLEKIFRQINMRHKDNKQRREPWLGYSTCRAWQGLVANMKQTSKDHAALSDILNNLVVNRLVEIGEDIQRIYKKCRDMAQLCQADISKVLSELLNAMKTYHQYHGESQIAENKLLRAQSQKVKVDQQSGLARKFVNYEKKSERKQAKYAENKLRALKARNEYLLSIDIANAAIRKYFDEDFPEMVKKMDAGYHGMVSQVLEVHATAQKILSERDQTRVAELGEKARSIQGSSDYETFYNSCQKVFTSPRKIEFQSHRGDEVTQISAQKGVQDEILVRLDQINSRVNKEKENKIEAAKNLELQDKQFFERLRGPNFNLVQYFLEDKSNAIKSPTEKSREDKIKLEDTFIEVFKENLLRDNMIVRLQTKYEALRKALGENVSDHIPLNARPPSLPPKPKRKITEVNADKQANRPQLFGGSIEGYVEATGEAIPNIMRSCIRVINLYGMHHQGIFRVSGSMSEMVNYKAQFERGDDPLTDRMDCDDINTVAGLLKLYFRELKDPLFPADQFDNLIKCSESVYATDGERDWKEMVRQIIKMLSSQRVVVMRYLFAFLSHVTEYSDENMMEAFNLSICFGPTLIIPPKERTDEHQYQGSINDLIKNIIFYHEEIFPPPNPEDYEKSAVYEKYFIGDKDFLGSVSDDDVLKGTLNEEDEGFDDDEAMVDEDYQAQNEKELSCRKGDVVTLLRKENNEWWNAELQNKTGLIPDRILNFSKNRSLHSSIRKSQPLNRSTECIMSMDFNQSQSSLNKTSSNQNVSENNTQSASTSLSTKQSGKKYRVSNISLQSINKSAPSCDNASLAAGLDNILAKVQSDIHSLGTHQQEVSVSSTRYKQTLVPVLPPLLNVVSQAGETNLVKPSLASNRIRTSDLDVIVTPPSPCDDRPFPVPLPSTLHGPITAKNSSPIISQKKPSPGPTNKWNSLPHNIPPSGSNSVPVSIPTVPSPATISKLPAGSSTNTSGSSYQLSQRANPTNIQSATLPRQSDKQSSAPPIVRAKPALLKKRISVEERHNPSPETVPKLPVTQQQEQTIPSSVTTTSAGSSSFSQPVTTKSTVCEDSTMPGSTFLANLETRSSSGERNQFSSFKISSNAQKKQ